VGLRLEVNPKVKPIVKEFPGSIGIEHERDGVAQQQLRSQRPVEPTKVGRVAKNTRR
jgi:hypothetical protein